MQLSQICKRSIVMLLVLCSLVGLFAGCGKDTADSTADPENTLSESVPLEEETEDPGKLSEIKTKFGKIYIPEKYEQLFQVEEEKGKNSGTVKFTTEQDGKTYTLFNISIGEGSGELVGTLTDKHGDSLNVYAEVYDLGDISGLPQDKQDQLYAMQEAVNVIVENLK